MIAFDVQDVCVRDIFAFGGTNVAAAHWDVRLTDREGTERQNTGVTLLTLKGGKASQIQDFIFDLGTLGQLGYVPGWPGAEVYPPQPMVAQTRYVLDQYAAQGGAYQEVVMADCGHCPYIEKPEEFNAAFFSHLQPGA